MSENTIRNLLIGIVLFSFSINAMAGFFTELSSNYGGPQLITLQGTNISTYTNTISSDTESFVSDLSNSESVVDVASALWTGAWNAVRNLLLLPYRITMEISTWIGGLLNLSAGAINMINTVILLIVFFAILAIIIKVRA